METTKQDYDIHVEALADLVTMIVNENPTWDEKKTKDYLIMQSPGLIDDPPFQRFYTTIYIIAKRAQRMLTMRENK